MSRDTFPFTPGTLRALQRQREQLECEDRRRAASRECITRKAFTTSRAARQPVSHKHRYCRDAAIHNALYTGDFERLKGIFRDDGSAEVLVETISEELQWSPEMGLWSLTPKKSHTSPLRITAGRGYADCVRYLINRGADPNSKAGGRVALHDSCESHHAECTRLLLTRGADPNLQDEDGRAPLHLCTTPETLECAKLLLEYGARVNLPCHYTRATPLHVACGRGLEGHVALYLSRGSDPCALNREGETPLNAACAASDSPQHFGRYYRVVELLLTAGGHPGTPGKKGHSPLHNASANCHLRLAQMLLDYGASVNVTNSAGYTPLDCALQVCTDYPECQPHQLVRLLLNHGAVPSGTKMWRFCAASPQAFEILLNTYDRIPPGDSWVASVPTEIWEENHTFYESVLLAANQPRPLQHLARCALRKQIGGQRQMALRDLHLPPGLAAYLLLQPEGSVL
ncbi:ankyrin repeat and SOCS box protein 16 [Spea bombifrons]|uniref:ankyrin repeat and SOCS box protein 16 n=1 Tax=Spea bombifrons TaxID=233779 RepID=UPI00234A9654|nr:ankyrin repeat and SOCS box protein 16 [Spea bombifrons]